MASNTLPEEIAVQILTRLPVKSLIRFTSISKWWHYIIISDPQFAKAQFELAYKKQSLSHRLLISSKSQLQSLDLEAPSFGDDSSVRKLTCPFKLLGRRLVNLLGSCNGMVFVAFGLREKFYVWNPTTGFVQKLPAPGFATEEDSEYELGISLAFLGYQYCGFGYVSANDEYKVFVSSFLSDYTFDVEIFSFRTKIWKRVQAHPLFSNAEIRLFDRNVKGTLSNEAVHWLRRMVGEASRRYAIIAFDLAKEEFREVPLPNLTKDDEHDSFSRNVGVLLGGCLCVSSYKEHCSKYSQLWVMMEYGVGVSWTKLYKFETVDQRVHRIPQIFYGESGITIRSNGEEKELMRIDRKKESLDEVAVCSGRYRLEVGDCDMVEYDESLLWLNDGRQKTQNPISRPRKKQE